MIIYFLDLVVLFGSSFLLENFCLLSMLKLVAFCALFVENVHSLSVAKQVALNHIMK